jgi:hypothetical protein
MRLHKSEVDRGRDEGRINKVNNICSSAEMKTPYSSRATYKK